MRFGVTGRVCSTGGCPVLGIEAVASKAKKCVFVAFAKRPKKLLAQPNKNQFEQICYTEAPARAPTKVGIRKHLLI